jgi:hypothetical protein
MHQTVFKKWLAGAAALTLLAGSVTAQATTLTFEGVGNFAKVNNFYNGGTDSAGNSGPNYGVSFVGPYGGPSGFVVGSTAPSPDTVLLGSEFTMNVADGFADQFSLDFSYIFGPLNEVKVDVFSGLNGGGDSLASITLGNSSCTLGAYCLASLDFSGTAKSVQFVGAPDHYDNFTLGAVAVPEPSSLAMLSLGLLGLGLALRRGRSESAGKD